MTHPTKIRIALSDDQGDRAVAECALYAATNRALCPLYRDTLQRFADGEAVEVRKIEDALMGAMAKEASRQGRSTMRTFGAQRVHVVWHRVRLLAENAERWAV